MSLPKESREVCKVELTAMEKQELSQDIAALIQQREETEEDKKAVTGEYKARIDGLTANINSKARTIRQGFRMESIACDVEYFGGSGQVVFYRKGTAERVKERPMTTEEWEKWRQMELDFAAERDQYSGATPPPADDGGEEEGIPAGAEQPQEAEADAA